MQGVTSWGYTDANAKVQGASFFGTNTQYPSTSTFGTFGAGNMAKLMFDGEHIHTYSPAAAAALSGHTSLRLLQAMTLTSWGTDA